MTCCDRRLQLGLTESVCPVCLATIPAERVAEGGTVYLKKTCPEHGTTSTPVWRGLGSYLRWGEAPRAFSQPPVCATEVKRGCPHDCGLCPDHRQQSCCVLLEVTSRCDLACPVCYASASRHGADASLAEIGGWLDTLAEQGGRVHIQLSGGEPTVRDDLPEIVALIRSRGFEFVQLNTNGVRIAREPEYLDALAKAGLDCVFLQFDGVTDDVYQRLRGAKLMRLKTLAIRNCGEAGIGVVLTPTLVPGVNAGQIGAIVDLAIRETPAVRAVHFQPVSYFGRWLKANPDDCASERPPHPSPLPASSACRAGSSTWPHPQADAAGRGGARTSAADNSGVLSPLGERDRVRGDFAKHSTGFSVTPPDDASRITLPEVMEALIGYSGGTIRLDDFHPGSAENPYCSFSGRFVIDASGRLQAVAEEPRSCCGVPAKQESGGCCGSPRPSLEVARERRYVAGQWTRPDRGGREAAGLDAFDEFLAGRTRTLGLSGMAFQDAWTLDLERLRQCHIHVVAPDRRVIPFCAYNLTDCEGRALYRPQAPAQGAG